MALGLAMAVGAGGCYAFYSVLTSQMSAHAPPAAIAGASFGLAGLAMIPLLVAIPPLWVLTPQAMLAMLFLGVIATGLSYALYTWGLTRVAPATAVTLALAEPLTAWVLATGVLGEAITPLKALGALALLAGLVLVARVPSQRS